MEFNGIARGIQISTILFIHLLDQVIYLSFSMKMSTWRNPTFWQSGMEKHFDANDIKTRDKMVRYERRWLLVDFVSIDKIYFLYQLEEVQTIEFIRWYNYCHNSHDCIWWMTSLGVDTFPSNHCLWCGLTPSIHDMERHLFHNWCMGMTSFSAWSDQTLVGWPFRQHRTSMFVCWAE